MTEGEKLTALTDQVARAICREDCAFRGEPACHTLPGAWPNPNCDDPGCWALAMSVVISVDFPPARRALEEGTGR